MSAELQQQLQETLEVVKSLKGKIDSYETLNKSYEELFKKHQETKQTLEDIQNELIEAKKYQKNDGGYDKKELGFLKALTSKSLVEARKSFEETQNTLDNELGGYLIPEKMSNQIIAPVFNEGANEIVSLPSTIITKVRSLALPVQDTLPIPYRRGELQEAAYTSVKFHKEMLSPNSLSCVISQSWEFMNYQNIYTPQKMIADLKQSYTSTIANEILNGKGRGQYLGVLEVNGLPTVTTQDKNKLTLKDIQKALAELKTAYNPVIIMHRKTWWYLQQLEDNSGRPLINSGVYSSATRSLYGYPLLIVGDILVASDEETKVQRGSTTVTMKKAVTKPIIETCNFNATNVFASGAYPILIGDFKIGYKQLIADSLTVIPDAITGASANEFKWIFHMYNDGMPTMLEAFVRLKIR